MDISLSSDNEKFIKNQIASGVYKSFSEAVNAVLNMAINNDVLKERINMLNDDLQKGVKSFEEGKYSDCMEFINELINEHEQI